jgi:wyosine [tRNA(Phe)-imidazoG37] synthetase (radical SAM superfamily)
MPELAFERFIDGIAAFRDQYHGKLWVEVMLVQGLNDSELALRDLAVVLKRIQPDEVHLNSPTRAPCEPWVKPVGAEVMDRAQRILGDVAHVVHPAEGEFDLSGYDNVVDAVVAVLMRHPVAEGELLRMLARWQPGHVLETLGDLERSGKAQVVTRGDERYWSYAAARYVEEVPPRCRAAKSEGEGEPA